MQYEHSCEKSAVNTQAFYIRYNHYVTSSQNVLFNEFKHLCDGLDVHMHISLLEINSLACTALENVLLFSSSKNVRARNQNTHAAVFLH